MRAFRCYGLIDHLIAEPIAVEVSLGRAAECKEAIPTGRDDVIGVGVRLLQNAIEQGDIRQKPKGRSCEWSRKRMFHTCLRKKEREIDRERERERERERGSVYTRTRLLYNNSL